MQTWASLFSPIYTHVIAFDRPFPSPPPRVAPFVPLNGKRLQMWPAGVQLRLCVRAKCQQPLEGDILERASTFRAELTAGAAPDSGDANDQLLMERGQPSC